MRRALCSVSSSVLRSSAAKSPTKHNHPIPTLTSLSRAMTTSRSSSSPLSDNSSTSHTSSSTPTSFLNQATATDADDPSIAPHIPRSRLRALLRQGHTVVGTMLANSTSTATLRTLHNASLDFVIIDNEHGMYSNHQLSTLCTTAVLMGLTPLVRVPDLQYHLIAQSLDGGAQGLVLPRIYTAEEVERVVQWARYPPVGVRGSAQWRAYSNWTGGPVSDAMQVMNREIILLFQIETAESVKSMDEILSVPGLDGVLIGPNDLSINLNTPDNWDSKPMQNAMLKCAQICQKKGLIAGIHVSDAAQSIEYAKKGFNLVSANSEMGFMAGAANTHVQTVKSALGDKAVDGSWRGRTGKAGY